MKNVRSQFFEKCMLVFTHSLRLSWKTEFKFCLVSKDFVPCIEDGTGSHARFIILFWLSSFDSNSPDNEYMKIHIFELQKK